MIIKHKKITFLSSRPSKQKGMALLGVVLMLLVVIGLISVTASRTTVLETKMIFNMQDKQRSLMAADSAAIFGWNQIKTGVEIPLVVNNDDQPGYYVLGDEVITTAKSNDDWNLNKNVMSWPWEDGTKRFMLSEQLGGTENPMKLNANPQYSIGLHNPVLRKGTSEYHCIPMTVIGASKGGSTQTRTLIELKTIPKNTCYHEKVAY